jgi:hypothetical protein
MGDGLKMQLIKDNNVSVSVVRVRRGAIHRARGGIGIEYRIMNVELRILKCKTS